MPGYDFDLFTIGAGSVVRDGWCSQVHSTENGRLTIRRLFLAGGTWLPQQAHAVR